MATTTSPPLTAPNHPVPSHPGRGTASSQGSSTEPVGDDEKKERRDLEIIHTASRVPGNSHYYEKDGLRTYGDDEDHDHEPPMTIHRIMSLVAMAFLWVGSQIPLYLFGGIPPYIYGDIGGADRWVWFVQANLLALAAICPFVGALSDLFGRRYCALFGALLIIIGSIVNATAQNMNIFIAGMALSGAGAGINELTALAATSELAPTAKRGKYVGVLVFTILPFAPSVLWGQLIAYHSTWRWIGLICAVFNFIGFLMVAFFYFPPPRVNSMGLSRKETIAQIDFVGGFLSIGGFIIFIAGLLWGGYQYTWTSVHTLAPLLIGAAMCVGFCLWEWKGAKYPMFPRRILRDPRIMICTLIITFVSGANFFSVLLFWPTQSFNMYGHDPIQVGLRGLPVGFGILIGAVVVLWLLSVYRGQNRPLMIISTIIMTAGCGALAAARVDNLPAVYGILTVAGLGIGGIVVPASIMTTIICPDDLIATVTALTLSIRVMGGAIGYTVYYNVFYQKVVPALTRRLTIACVNVGIYNSTTITIIGALIGESLIEPIKFLKGVDGNLTKWEYIVKAGEMGYADAYPYVYYCSIAFGAVSIIAALCLGDIEKYMDDHVAVVMH